MSEQNELPPLAPGTRILDVRELLRAGHEPFNTILEVLEGLHPGQGLAVRAIFEPRPLIGLFKARGFKGRSHKLADDDWLLDFQPETQAPSRSTPLGSSVPRQEKDDSEPVDVRGLEPPEPMVRVLSRCHALPEGQTLKVIHERRPEFLYPQLDALGLIHHTEAFSDEFFHISITRPKKRGV